MTPPLRVMIDARMLLGRFSGVARFVTGLVEALAGQPDLRIVALCGDEPFTAWEGRTDIEMMASSFSRRDRSLLRRMWWEETRLPAIVKQSGVDLYHATWNSGIPLRCRVPAVLSLHDLIPWHDPAHCFPSRLHALGYRYATRAAVGRARVITTVSDLVRRDVLHTLRADPNRVVTVPNGMCLQEGKRPSENVEKTSSLRPFIPSSLRPYALYIGGHEPRKNVAGVFAAMQRFWTRFAEPLDLRLTGTPQALCPAARSAYESWPFKERIQFLGSPDDKTLEREYAGASFLLMLSKAEGFGLPVLEAFASGCPVIAAQCTSLPEVVGDAGILVAPENADATVEAMHRLLTQPEFRNELATRGRRRAALFDWSILRKRWREVYLRAMVRSRLPVTSSFAGALENSARAPAGSPR